MAKEKYAHRALSNLIRASATPTAAQFAELAALTSSGTGVARWVNR